ATTRVVYECRRKPRPISMSEKPLFFLFYVPNNTQDGIVA
ncbi:MAG: hypothetical protein QOG37_2223, partial [Mycobacterium sp.]|nr:hypothetical protein [Mycobacterium sp.]